MYINIRTGKEFEGEYPDVIELSLSDEMGSISITKSKKVQSSDPEYEHALDSWMFTRGYVKEITDNKKEYLRVLEEKQSFKAIQDFLLCSTGKIGVEDFLKGISSKDSTVRLFCNEIEPILRMNQENGKYVAEVNKGDIVAFSSCVYVRSKDVNLEENINFSIKEIVKKTLKNHLATGSQLTDDEIRVWLIDKCSNKLESVLCLDEDMKVICDVKSRDSDEIILSEGTKRRLNNGYVFHNHPEASSFSASDILFAMRYNLKEMVVGGVTDEGKVIIYVIKRGDSWGDAYEPAMQWFEEVEQKGLPGIPPDVKMNDKRHKINKEFAKKFGFEYSAKILSP